MESPFGLPRSSMQISFTHDFFDGHVDGNFYGERDIYVLTVRKRLDDDKGPGDAHILSISWGHEVVEGPGDTSLERISRTNLTAASEIRALLLQDAAAVVEGSLQMEPHLMVSHLLLPYVRNTCPMKTVLEILGF